MLNPYIMKRRIPILIMLIFSLMTNFCLSQKDSLLNVIESESADTSIIDALNQLSRSYLGTNPDTSVFYAKQASELAESVNDYKRMGTALKNVGLGYYYQADYVSVLEFWEASLAAFQEADDPKGISNLLSNIGAVYYSTGDNTKAVDYYLRAQRIAEKSGEDFRLATVLQNIGAVYERTKEFDKAESYLLQALEICKLLEYDKGIGTVALNLGDVYMQLDNYDLAETYLNQAREYFIKTNDNYIASPLVKIGEIEMERGNYQKALSYLYQAERIAEEKETNLVLQLAYIGEGNVHLRMKNPGLALKAFQNAYEIGKTIGLTEELQETFQGLTNAYKQKGDYRNATRFQDSLLKATKDVYDVEKNNQIENLQLSFDIEKKQSEINILNADNEIKSAQIARAKIFRNFLLAIAALLIVVIGGVAYQYNYVRKTNKIITEERNKSDKLLLNILPEETADELKQKGLVKAQKHDHVTVLFTDFVNFTGTAGKMPPEELVKTIDYYFKNFDEITQRHNLEKIKTIGDAYMCAGGLPKKDENNTVNALMAAADIVKFVEETHKNPPEGIKPFQIRIGLNCGPLVAGVVGSRKFQYDIWGDTVNIAARMETKSEPNKINVSESIYELLKDELNFSYRGELDVKNKGKMKMYFFDPVHDN